LRIPKAVKKALDIALSGTIQTVHLGKITLNSGDELSLPSSRITRYFLLMAGIGFDAEATRSVNERIKKFAGKGAYLWSGLKALLRYDPGAINLSIKEESTDAAPAPIICGYSVVIGNASCYGGAFRVTPDARLTDPYLYVFVTHKRTGGAMMRYILGVISGKHLAFSDVSYLRASEIVVEGEAPVQIDGDYEGTAPAKVQIERDALRLVMPPLSKI
jgi:diacylglycerol kinase family enzyme